MSLIKKAIDLYALSGRSSTGATMARDCAQKMEEDYDYEAAQEMYARASQLYELDNQPTNAQSQKLKSVELILLVKKYEQLPHCIKVYEKVAKKYLS